MAQCYLEHQSRNKIAIVLRLMWGFAGGLHCSNLTTGQAFADLFQDAIATWNALSVVSLFAFVNRLLDSFFMEEELNN